MGVKHLWDVLDSCKKTLPLHCLENKRVCIDLSCWMVQLHNVNKSHCTLKYKVYLQGLFHRIRALIALNCTIIFISDGSIPAIKLSTYRRRLNSRVEVPQHQPNSEKATSLRRNLGSDFSIMIKEAKLLGLALGIPCLDGIEEAEAQCALLNLESLCDGCFTSDSDVFLFGARTVYRDICLGEGGHVVCYEMDDIESKLGFGRNSLISLALLLGGDYSPGVHGMGPESACQIVKSIGDTLILQHMISEGLSFAKKKKCSKKQGQPQKCSQKNSLDHYINMDAGTSHNPQRDSEIQQVINAYLKPKCHSADSATVHRVLAQHPFQRAKLQQLCLHFFQWPPEKTDEYILPKIAERDLRRYANFRSTSLELGVKLPLHKIPVKCPVSGIIKRRKAQGRECFEVLWDDLDGLTSSIVPAHLIESACPEKIEEFEKKAQEKKQNNNKQRRSKKPENKASLAELELRLQNLLLDIESGSNAASTVTFPSAVSSSINSSCTSNVDRTDQNLTLHDSDEESNSDCNTTQLWCPTSLCSTKKEVIDLLSPSPLVNNKAISRRPRATCQGIEVISLSDSESDMSPEHERKAGELRSFLASIKDNNLKGRQ